MALASGCYRRRLTLLFSATWSSQTELLAVLLQGPIKVTVAGIPRVISQEVELIPKAARFRRLRDLLREFGDAKVLVFVLFKREARLVAKMLQGEGIQSWALEGNMSQAARSSAMQAFRDAKAGWSTLPEADVDFALAQADGVATTETEEPAAACAEEVKDKPQDESKSQATGWGSLMSFGKELLAEARSHRDVTYFSIGSQLWNSSSPFGVSSCHEEPGVVDSPDDKPRAELTAVLHHYQDLLEDIYRKHNREKLSDIPKLIDKFRYQAESVEDLSSFKIHCEEKLKSFHQAVCKKYGIDLSEEAPAEEDGPHRVRAAIVAIYEKHNPAKLGNIDQLLTKFKGQETTLYRSICEKYGVEPDSQLVEDEPKNDAGHWGGGFFGGGSIGFGAKFGGALNATGAFQSLQSAAEGLQGLREKVERSFDEALADRGDAIQQPAEDKILKEGGIEHESQDPEIVPKTENETEEVMKHTVEQQIVRDEPPEQESLDEKRGNQHFEKEKEEAGRLEQERLEQERLEQERIEAERQEQERLEKEKEDAERVEQERLEQERLEQKRIEAERQEQERLEKEKEEAERLEQERLEQERMEQERIEAERQEQERLEREKEERERIQQEKQDLGQEVGDMLRQEHGAEQGNPFEEVSPASAGKLASKEESGEGSPEPESLGEGLNQHPNKALELLAEYEVRVKAVYQRYNPDAPSDPHLDQILGKYREQILSRPEDANNPQVLERYRERLESLYKAICARYNAEEAKEPQDMKAMYEASSVDYIVIQGAIYREHNPTKLSEVDKLIDKYSEQLPVLYQSICQKYDVTPSAELAENEAKGEIQSTEESKSRWGTSFLTSGLQTLKTLHGAAEGIRQHMEHTFEEAIRSEEDISTMTVVQGLSKAAEKGAAKAEMKSKEVTSPPTALTEASVASETVVGDAGSEVAQPKGGANVERTQELEQLQAEKERLLQENQKLKAEKENLILEGTKMSRRVLNVEERMKAVTADMREAEATNQDAERKTEQLQAQLVRQKEKADKAEAQVAELKTDNRKIMTELERAKQQLQGEKRQMQADQQALQMKTRESTERERRMEERIQQLCHERDELRATSSSLTVELQQALRAVDNLERRLQQQIQETEQLQEQHRRQLEVAEYEFVNESMPYQQRLGELEAQLAHQEQKFLEREAIAYRERDKERAELEAAKEELRQREAQQERRARELREEVERAQRAQQETAELRREIAEVESAREVADRKCEVVEGELKLETARRKFAEQRGDDLQQQVEKLQSSALATQGQSLGSENEVQLRMQVSTITQQRDTLQQETLKLRERLEAQRAGDAANAQLVQRFELALQAIGKLQEELEACQAQRDSYQKQCQNNASQGAEVA
eukprot:symbB.v1.2.014872.t1/scaffold1098.1/size138148/4